MMNELKEPHMATIKNAAQKLTGTKRRAFQAQVVLDYLNGSARRAETVFGWSRRTVTLGLHELQTGITCVDNTAARGNRAVYLPTADKYRRLTRRLSQGQKGLEERALVASPQPSEPW